MSQELQIKATISNIESKLDKNANPFSKISLANLPQRYFYAFSFSLDPATLSLLQTPLNLINRQVLITYQELPNQDGNGTFCKVQAIQIL